MRLAKIVFLIAGIWGVLAITPLYFMFDVISRNDPPPITHPGFFYGLHQDARGCCVEYRRLHQFRQWLGAI